MTKQEVIKGLTHFNTIMQPYDLMDLTSKVYDYTIPAFKYFKNDIPVASFKYTDLKYDDLDYYIDLYIDNNVLKINDYYLLELILNNFKHPN